MTSNLFSKPNYSKDEEELARETKQQFKLSEKMWKPTKDIENHIRILPARGDSNASYHMKIGKHFIEHSDRTESFICMRETYGGDCPACEAYYKIREDAGKEKAYPYWPKLYGVFNIIDRAEENPKVKLYEAPRTLVWKKIIFINKGSIKIIDEFDEKGECVREGRDLIILFYPKAEVHNKYVVYPGDQNPLGTAEEIENWHKDIVDLIPEQIALYGPIEYEVAKIKAFGSQEERDEMREKLKEKYEAAQKEKEESGKSSESKESKVASVAVIEVAKEIVEEGKEDELEDAVAKAKKMLAEAEAKKAEKEKKKAEESEDVEEPETDKVAQLEKELANAKAEKAKEAVEKKAKDKDAKKKSEKIKEEPKPKPEEKNEKKSAKSEAELDDKIAEIKRQIKEKKEK